MEKEIKINELNDFNDIRHELISNRFELDLARKESESLSSSIRNAFFSIVKPATKHEIDKWIQGAKSNSGFSGDIRHYNIFYTDKEVIDRISILCEKYLKTQDNKILDEINSISLKGFNLLVPSEDGLHNTIKKVNLNEFDEKKFFKQIISHDLSQFENTALLAKRYKDLFIKNNIYFYFLPYVYLFCL